MSQNTKFEQLKEAEELIDKVEDLLQDTSKFENGHEVDFLQCLGCRVGQMIDGCGLNQKDIDKMNNMMNIFIYGKEKIIYEKNITQGNFNNDKKFTQEVISNAESVIKVLIIKKIRQELAKAILTESATGSTESPV